MKEYRRWRAEGGTFFFTLVTYRRQRFLTSDVCREALREAFRRVRRLRPFTVVAIVLLLDLGQRQRMVRGRIQPARMTGACKHTPYRFKTNTDDREMRLAPRLTLAEACSPMWAFAEASPHIKGD